MPEAPAVGERLSSLDQLRGYTVAGMILVNTAGGFEACPELLKHTNRYCGYADTIMPQFFFAVGLAYRLTLQRRIARDGTRPAYVHAILRNLKLLGIGILLYGLDRPAGGWEAWRAMGWGDWLIAAFTGTTFQTLVHIAVTALWVTPVMGARARWRLAFLVASGALHLWLSERFYYEWIQHHRTIDGGVLGFLSWTIPMLAGSLACDLLTRRGPKGALPWLCVGGTAAMLLGYGLSCGSALAAGETFAAPPFTPPWHLLDIWTMSQKAGSVSYQAFGAGLSLALLALCVALCDLKSWRLGAFRTLGQNALMAYVVHILTARAFVTLTPGDAPGLAVAACVLLTLALTWAIMRGLEARGIYWKL